MMQAHVVDEPFGPPPPLYPCTVKAVRVNGSIVTGDAAKALPSVITLDILVNTLDGVREFQGVANGLIADPTVDVNGSILIGAKGWLFYIPEEQAIVPLIYIPPDSIECTKL
jgi:hypothetical protein